jgi:hypothetical protein
VDRYHDRDDRGAYRDNERRTSATIGATGGVRAIETETTTEAAPARLAGPPMNAKGSAAMEIIDQATWRSRCAQRIAELDQDISRVEAERLAKDVYAFERTRAMDPEAAAEFISIEMARPDRAPFERRSQPREAARDAG